MSIENIISSIPTQIVKEIKEPCHCCGAEKTQVLQYTLQIKVSRTYNLSRPIDRYHAFYLCGARPSGDSLRYIGQACGLGETSLEQALLKLKERIKNEIQHNDKH